MGGSGGITFNRGINRGAGTSRCSYRSPGNTFNVDIEYIWVVAVAIHLIGIYRGAGTSRGSYISPGNTLNGDIEYIWVVTVAPHLIEALIEVQVHQEVATYLRVTHLMWIQNIWVVMVRYI
jgi:hypothetical protein